MLKAIMEKRRRTQSYFYGIGSYVVVEDVDDCECIFEEGMTEYEMAVAFVRSGKCRLSDAAVRSCFSIHSRSSSSTDSTNKQRWVM